MLTPQEVNKKERMIFNKLNSVYFSEYSLDHIIRNEKNGEYIVQLFEIFQDKKFFCYIKKSFSLRRMKYTYKIYICLRVDADNHDLFLSYLLAIKLKILMVGDIKNEKIVMIINENMNYILSLEKKTFFEEIKLKGWSTHFSILEERYCRYHLLFK
jgi:hypothetical protein